MTNLISNTPTEEVSWSALVLTAVGKKVSVADLKALNIEPDYFHGDWNYVIVPRPLLRRSLDLLIPGR